MAALSTSHLLLRASVVALSVAAWPPPHAALAADVLPQGGHYVSGSGTISSQGGALAVTQPGSTRGVIEWTGFSIGAGNTVTFDNGTGATLNRVTGGSPSTLLGNLNATGSVYLINPQGVLVGRDGVISTGGRFVASTLDVPDSAFMNGGTLTFSGISSGRVVNLGRIGSSGADVFLIAHDAVVNAGSVSAANGTAEYVAGQQVVLYESSASRQVFVQIASHGNVVDRGTTQAAQINLEAADGNIYALAGSGSRIRATGTALRDGHIWLVAGNGSVTQQGTLAATNANGSGGTVDTLANTLTLQSDASVLAGTWNVSTPNLAIDSATAGAFMRSLNAGTNVDATATGTNGASGDLTLASNLAWTGPAALALVASRNITIDAATTLANTGSGNLAVKADAANIDNGGSVLNRGSIDWSKSTGTVSLMTDMNGSYSPGTLLANPSWSAPAYSGLVTQITAYRLVNSVADLQAVANDMAGNYALGRDIDGNRAPLTTLGTTGYAITTPFSGQFDGMWHTIANVAPNLGALFGDIASNGVVRDLRVNAQIGGEDDGNYNGVAILGLDSHGTIINTFVSGANACQCLGGVLAALVGRNYGLIERSGSDARVLSGSEGDGLVTTNYGRIDESYMAGSAAGTTTHGSASGLAGRNFGSITQSFVAGPVSAGNGFGAHGVCGGCSGLGADVYWDITVTGQPSSGGNLPLINGLTTAEMSIPASFVGWDFGPNGAWAMPPGATHPVLRWQLEH